MKRLDFAFALVLSVLAAFVGVQAFAMRSGGDGRVLVRSTGSSATTLAADAPGAGVVRASDRPRGASRGTARERSRADVRSRLELSSEGTYIGEVLAAHDSALARWPDRGALPLRVWIQPMARVRDWTPNHVAIVRDAFIEWGESGVPLAFSFVLDSASADVHVSWIDRFNEPISGKTLWSHDNRWSILEASIVLAVHHRTGELLDTAATRAIALHEVGHLIGLDHTTDTTSIMTPRVRVKVLSPADLATARLLYLLPSGPIGGERSGTR
ncbi:MAG: matrixin family metalloprotease [Gemmatimonadetes bacterium]|nr:matrixin family metalloprotease [Gemmatimonadota bacterium]MCC6771107.1 matrixin family metalloprotease [Gemmatimonadaceae bacterium]